MPSTSKKQRNFMAAAAHNPAFAKKVGIPVSVAKEFNAADKGKKFGTGGSIGRTIGGQNQIGKQRTRFGSTLGYEKNIPNVNNNKYIGKKEGGLMNSCKTEAKKAVKGHEKRLHGMAKGGMARMEAKGEHSVQKQSKRGAEMVKMARGGGVEVKGKTKGTMIKMKGC